MRDYITLRTSQKTLKTDREDITPWLLFFLKILLKQSQISVDLLSAENIQKTLSQKQLAAWQYLKNVGQASPLEIAESTGIARPTVNQVMGKLLRLKRVERIGLGRSTRYQITEN